MAETPSLWQFACRLYARDGVQAALLSLQDDDGVDIPFLLFLLWHGRYIGALDRAGVSKYWQRARSWSEELVQPVRRGRRWLAAQSGEDRHGDDLYRQLQDTELACEKRLLSVLENLVRREAGARGSVADGICCAGHYLSLQGLQPQVGPASPGAGRDGRLAALISEYRAIED